MGPLYMALCLGCSTGSCLLNCSIPTSNFNNAKSLDFKAFLARSSSMFDILATPYRKKGGNLRGYLGEWGPGPQLSKWLANLDLFKMIGKRTKHLSNGGLMVILPWYKVKNHLIYN